MEGVGGGNFLILARSRGEALKAAEGITPRDKDPQEYVEENSGGTPKDSDRAGDAPDESLKASETEG